MYLLSKKREYWKIRARGIFLKSNSILTVKFCFVLFSWLQGLWAYLSLKLFTQDSEGSKDQPVKLAAFPVSLKASGDSVRNKYMQRLSVFSRNLDMIPENHSFIYSFICPPLTEPWYGKITELGTEINMWVWSSRRSPASEADRQFNGSYPELMGLQVGAWKPCTSIRHSMQTPWQQQFFLYISRNWLVSRILVNIQ